jgi:opacity protein-like surface antigen
MRKTMLVMAILFLAVGADSARAQDFRWGPELSLAEDADFGLGARIEFDFDGPPLTLIGSFDYFFPDPDDVDYWELNANLVYNFRIADAPSITPYAGGGLNIAHVSIDRGDSFDDASDTDPGLNILGGVKFDAGPVTPFVEIKFEIEGGDQFIVTGGLLF